METYSKVFTTHDGIDNSGVRAEVKVQTGRAKVEDIKKSKAGKAANVLVRVDGSEYTISGWVPVNDPVYDKALEAQETGEPIDFRVEHLRKPNIDRTLPIADLTQDMTTAKNSINKAFTAAKLPNEETWVLSPKMRTRMEEDPRDSIDPNSVSLEDFTGGGHPIAKSQPADTYSSELEAPPFKTHNHDGSINPGSYASAVPINILLYIIDKDRQEKIGFTEGQKAMLAKVVLDMTNRLQNHMYNGELEAPMIQANSHTRSRSIVFSVIEGYYPMEVSILESKDSVNVWKENVLKKAKGLWDWNMKEVSALL